MFGDARVKPTLPAYHATADEGSCIDGGSTSGSCRGTSSVIELHSHRSVGLALDVDSTRGLWVQRHQSHPVLSMAFSLPASDTKLRSQGAGPSECEVDPSRLLNADKNLHAMPFGIRTGNSNDSVAIAQAMRVATNRRSHWGADYIGVGFGSNLQQRGSSSTRSPSASECLCLKPNRCCACNYEMTAICHRVRAMPVV